MSERLSFPGLEVSQYSPEGLFFGLVPQVADLPRIKESIERLRARVGLRGQPLSPECLHVSLFDLGAYVELPKEIVAAARAAGAEVSISTFDMILDHAMTFYRKGRKYPFVLRPGDEIAALVKLHKALGLAMRKAGLKRWATSYFTPHMTLSYDRRIIRAHPVETVRWRVSELVLVHSLRGQGKHIHLARWPLH